MCVCVTFVLGMGSSPQLSVLLCLLSSRCPSCIHALIKHLDRLVYMVVSIIIICALGALFRKALLKFVCIRQKKPEGKKLSQDSGSCWNMLRCAITGHFTPPLAINKQECKIASVGHFAQTNSVFSHRLWAHSVLSLYMDVSDIQGKKELKCTANSTLQCSNSEIHLESLLNHF